MLLGIIAGLTTSALWGLTFIAPRAVTPFTAWDLTIARYDIFGLACLLLMIDRRFRPIGIAPSRLLIGLPLGGAGYVVSVAFAVQLAGAAVPPVIIAKRGPHPCRRCDEPCVTRPTRVLENR